MILTDKEIKSLSINNNLISPFDDKYLQSESYDLHIGNCVYSINKNITLIDLKNKEGLKEMYSKEYISDNGYIIAPQDFVLVSIAETVSLTEKITAHIRPKTSITRAGLYINAQHFNSTYTGQLLMGLYNFQSRPIKIYPGISICQILFEELKGVPSENKLYKNKDNAHYQNEKEFRGPVVDELAVNKMVDYLMGELQNANRESRSGSTS